MAREAALTDFTLTIDGIGAFRFARRTMRDEIKIQVDYARTIDGVEPTPWLSMVGGWLATLRVLTVDAPDEWDLEELDPLDDAVYARLLKVHTALADKERSFRKGYGKSGQKGREDEGGDGRVLVSEKVHPDLD